MKRMKRAAGLFLVLALLLGLLTPASAVDKSGLESAAGKTAAYVLQSVPAPQPGSIGGEWAVLALARGGYSVPAGYFDAYYSRIEAYVQECGGVLHEKKYTEYARVALALTAIGKDPRNVAGYDLLQPLGDYKKVVWQGLNGPVFALLALDAGAWAMPENPKAAVQATRQMYVDYILKAQLSDGGWSLAGKGAGDADMTAMSLQALSAYTGDAAVSAAVEKGLAHLSAQQETDGAYSSWGAKNAESTAQVLVALCSLGVDLTDSRFVKNGSSVLDGLLTFRQADGSFLHTADGTGSAQMATEQALCALAAAGRSLSGKSALYRMGDVGAGTGLPGKDLDIKPLPVTAGTALSDITFSENAQAIRNMASRGIINGVGGGLFQPGGSMTRAEFATMVVRGLGLQPVYRGVFQDVQASAWYAAYVDTANAYGLVSGVGGGKFNPNGTMTRQEAATLMARAAKLCGMHTALDAAEAEQWLSAFSDGEKAADWAKGSIAFCCKNGLIDKGAAEFGLDKTILRCEIAQMFYELLRAAQLL